MRRIPEIKITSVFSGRDIHKIKSEMCDFIISATSLDGYRLNRDIINVGNLLSASDIERLEEQVKGAEELNSLSRKRRFSTPN